MMNIKNIWKYKESLFASINSYITDSVVLDLFAGSGNLGIEAISNGANKCYFVDNNKICIKTINENVECFNIKDKANILNMDYKLALKHFKNNKIKFDLILVDPPYDYQIINEILQLVSEYKLLNNNGIIVLEYQKDNLENVDNNFSLLKHKKYGDKYVSIYKFFEN